MDHNLAHNRLKRMHRPNCGVTLRSKRESLTVILERLHQLKLERKSTGKEAKLLKRILEAVLGEEERC